MWDMSADYRRNSRAAASALPSSWREVTGETARAGKGWGETTTTRLWRWKGVAQQRTRVHHCHSVCRSEEGGDGDAMENETMCIQSATRVEH